VKPALGVAVLLGFMVWNTPALAEEDAPSPPAAAESAPPRSGAGMTETNGSVPARAAAPDGEIVRPAAQDDLSALREELERLRREAEEAQRRQEERIRALEQQIEQLQKAAAPPAAPAPAPITTRPGFRARLYGFARADVDVDSRKFFAGPHLPFWVLSPDDPRARNRTDGAFTIHPRLTRLGLDTEASPVRVLGDARLTGKVEIDFFNILPDRNSATSNSRAFVRMRHGYGELAWKNARFLFGQYWDLISPLFPAANFDVVMWNAGNTADRRPQLRFTWEPPVGRGKASLGFMIGSPSAVDSQDLDADQIVDGEESRTPALQVRTAINQPSWVQGQTWEIGLWGHRGRFRINEANAIAGRRSFSSYAAGTDIRVPVSRRFLFQGEAWLGKALSDVRGGVGQSVNIVTGQEIRANGGWAELLYLVNPIYTLGGGFTLDDPFDRDVVAFNGTDNQTAVGRTQNRSYYIVNRLNLGSGLIVGVDWMFFRTKFRGLAPGSSNRWNTWIQHNF
jgi:hypothetical protein